MPYSANIYIDQFTDYSIIVNACDDYGNPIDVSNSTFTSQARKIYETNPIYAFDINVSGGSNGEIFFSIPMENTANNIPGKYQYDVLMTNETGTIKILQGIIFILDTATETGQ